MIEEYSRSNTIKNEKAKIAKMPTIEADLMLETSFLSEYIIRMTPVIIDQNNLFEMNGISSPKNVNNKFGTILRVITYFKI